MVRNGGDDWLTNVQIDILYDGTTYEAKFFDFKDPSVSPVTETISTSVSSADVGSFYNLVGNEIQVQTSHRQASDPDWVVPNSDWKLQVFTKTNDIYCSSYINNESCTWITQFYYDGDLTGTGTWEFPCTTDTPEPVTPEPVTPEPVFTAGETVQTSFSVVGEEKLDYVLPTVDDSDGATKWEIELRGDKGTQLADFIELDKFGKKHTLKFKPKLENEGNTYYFSIHLLKEGADDGEKFPMEVTITSTFDPSTLPSLLTGSKLTFEHEFRYLRGANVAYNKIHAKDRENFTQELRVLNEGVETRVDITYFYDGETYSVTF